MEQLVIDFDEVIAIMEGSRSVKTDYYLDLETGDIVALSHKVAHAMEEEDCQMLNHLPDALRPEIKLAADVLGHRSHEFALIPTLGPSEQIRLRLSFAASLGATESEQLKNLLTGKGAIRRFTEAIKASSRLQRRWEAFKREMLTARIVSWLHDHDAYPVVPTATTFESSVMPYAQ